MASAFIRPAAAQTYRGFGAGAFVLDDNHHHTLTMQTPQPGDPGYSDWALNGSLVFKLPIPPVSGASMAFMLPGPSTLGPSQIPVWDPPTSAGGTGGSQGVWRSTSLLSAISSIGFITGSGTANNLTKWTGASTVGNSTISETAGVVTFGGYGVGALVSDANGVITSSPIALGSDVSGTLLEIHGGTGNNSYVTGDMLYASAANTLSKLAAGSPGQVLTIVGGVPSWQTFPGGGSVTSVDGSGGTTGLTLTGGPITSSGTLTLGGTLASTNGGTGQTTYTTGDILYASSPTTLSRLPAGGMNQVLGTSGGTPTWITNGATVTNTTTTPAPLVISADNYTIPASATYIRLSNGTAGSLDVTGISSAGISDGRQITIVNISTSAIIIRNQNPASMPADQFDLPGGADIVLAQRGTATFIYDAALHFWELVSTN